MKLRARLSSESTKRQVIIEEEVVPDPSRCVQCGICSYYCPIGIDTRRQAWVNEPVIDCHCLTCGECVERCPRTVLRFEKTSLYAANDEFVNYLKTKPKQKVIDYV